MENKDKSKKQKKKVIFKGRKEEIVSDVNGSYTGVPVDPMDTRPVQDADDLWKMKRTCGAWSSFAMKHAFGAWSRFANDTDE